ncbi:MAG: hypothetical protein OEP48_16640 [Betaproteobacteria bacterium]|nr:hypothetical protein [Betaproteobacteria bacterium]MDH3438571.1 hypothetical protein [Betaproteobacteria bacterium]
MNTAGRLLWLLLVMLGPLGLFGCATGPAKQSVSPTEAIRATEAPPEATLLDVGIQVLHTVEIDTETAEEQSTHPKILEAEARYIPFHLKNTLQQTGQWGAVRVVPARAEEVDVNVSGMLLESNGETLTVAIKVVDAAGRVWFHNEYTAEATEKSYETLDKKERDPYQDLYNRVANDMLAYRKQLSARELSAIRQVALLKFARSVAPHAFDGYLTKDGEGIFKVSRLPADNDPMFERVNRIRAREYMFIDTVNLYYGNLYDDMRQPYGQWRKSSLEELNQKRALERKAWERRLLGLAAIIGGVVVGTNSNSSGGAAASGVMVIGGYEVFRSGGQFANDAKVHEEALKELGVSFEGDVAPVVDEVEGRTLKLSGSVDAQYAEWRKTLRELFAQETGLSPVASTPPAGKSPEPDNKQ